MNVQLVVQSVAAPCQTAIEGCSGVVGLPPRRFSMDKQPFVISDLTDKELLEVRYVRRGPRLSGPSVDATQRYSLAPPFYTDVMVCRHGALAASH